MLWTVCRAAGVERVQKPPFPLIKSGFYMHFFPPLSSSHQILRCAKLEEAKVKSDATADRAGVGMKDRDRLLASLGFCLCEACSPCLLDACSPVRGW